MTDTSSTDARPEPFELPPMFEHFTQVRREIDLFNAVVQRGISTALTERELCTALDALRLTEADESFVPPDIDAVEAYAKSQDANGLPMLGAACIVFLWGLMEATITDIAAWCVRSIPQCRTGPILAGMKGPVLEFSRATPQEQAEWIVEQIEQGTAAKLKPGIGRYEALLDAVQLSGGIPDGIRRDFMEFSVVRNVSVHAAGIADHRAIRACPWLSDRLGKHLVYQSLQYRHYSAVSDWYIGEIAVRLAALSHSQDERGIKRMRQALSKTAARADAMRASRFPDAPPNG